MAKVMRKEARHTQRRDRASGFPWKSSSIYPHHQSLPTLLLCALTYTSDLGFFDSSHSDWQEMVPHSGFDLHFSDHE